jgi:hypothetical protein
MSFIAYCLVVCSHEVVIFVMVMYQVVVVEAFHFQGYGSILPVTTVTMRVRKYYWITGLNGKAAWTNLLEAYAYCSGNFVFEIREFGVGLPP